MKSAIVTGAKGWLGSRLVTHLSKGLPDYPQPEPYEVIGTDKDDLNLLNADKVREFFQQHRGSTVFHTAGIIHPPRVADFYKVNVEATRNVLQARGQGAVGPLREGYFGAFFDVTDSRQHIFRFLQKSDVVAYQAP